MPVSKQATPERDAILSEAHQIKKLGFARFNTRLFGVLKDALSNNAALQKEQRERTERKKSILIEQQSLKDYIHRIETNEIHLGVYQPNYEAISTQVKESNLHINNKESFIKNLEGPEQRDLLYTLFEDFSRQFKNTLSESGAPKDIIKWSEPSLEEYIMKSNPLITQKLFRSVRGSECKKDDGDTSTRITIDPISLLENFEFSTIIAAQRWCKQAPSSFETTCQRFAHSNGHLDGPTI